jgi:outer membrane translocation and assembly module TamA
MLAPPPEVRGLPAGCAAAGEPVPGTTFIPIGGDQLLLGQLELRVEMFKLFGNWVAVAAFLDAGDVAQPAKLVDPTNLHYAVGGGLRYNTVVGAIRFDLGARLNRLDERGPLGVRNPDPGERIAFHISIGEAF